MTIYTVNCVSCGRKCRTEEAFSDPTGPKPLCSFCQAARGVTMEGESSDYVAPTERIATALEATLPALERIATALEHLANAHPIRRQ